MIIKLINKSTNPDPEYSSSGAIGFDIRADLPKGPVLLSPDAKISVGTGLFMDLPEGSELQIRTLMEMADKYGVTILNAPGVFDGGKSQEVKVVLYNYGPRSMVINHGDPIAKGVITDYWKANFVKPNLVKPKNRLKRRRAR